MKDRRNSTGARDGTRNDHRNSARARDGTAESCRGSAGARGGTAEGRRGSAGVRDGAMESRRDSTGARDYTMECRDPSPVRFTCHLCGLSEECAARGPLPPFSRSVRCLEASAYVMRDPFGGNQQQVPPIPVLVGADCAVCSRPVCQHSDCSLFYSRTFCLPCVRANVEQFPAQVQAKLS